MSYDMNLLQQKLKCNFKPTVMYQGYKMLIFPFSVPLSKILSRPLIYFTTLTMIFAGGVCVRVRMCTSACMRLCVGHIVHTYKSGNGLQFLKPSVDTGHDFCFML